MKERLYNLLAMSSDPIPNKQTEDPLQNIDAAEEWQEFLPLGDWVKQGMIRYHVTNCSVRRSVILANLNFKLIPKASHLIFLCSANAYKNSLGEFYP